MNVKKKVIVKKKKAEIQKNLSDFHRLNDVFLTFNMMSEEEES
jgi:hypothetical protein